MTRTLTCDRCHKDTDHLNPVYDDSGERSVILGWCETCYVGDACRRCEECDEYVLAEQAVYDRIGLYRRCLACRRPAPTDEGARLRNAIREALKRVRTLGQWDVLSLRENGTGMYTANAPWARDVLAQIEVVLSNALERAVSNEGEGK
jgi:hypothetical protein